MLLFKKKSQVQMFHVSAEPLVQKRLSIQVIEIFGAAQDYDWLPNQLLVWAWSRPKRRIDGVRVRRRWVAVSRVFPQGYYQSAVSNAPLWRRRLIERGSFPNRRRPQFSSRPSQAWSQELVWVRLICISICSLAVMKKEKKTGLLACKVSDPEWHCVRVAFW